MFKGFGKNTADNIIDGAAVAILTTGVLVLLSLPFFAYHAEHKSKSSHPICQAKKDDKPFFILFTMTNGRELYVSRKDIVSLYGAEENVTLIYVKGQDVGFPVKGDLDSILGQIFNSYLEEERNDG